MGRKSLLVDSIVESALEVEREVVASNDNVKEASLVLSYNFMFSIAFLLVAASAARTSFRE